MPRPEASTASRDLAPERALESSLAMELLTLFALVAGSEEESLRSKRSFVSAFFQNLYPPDITTLLCRRFDDLLLEKPDPEEFSRSLNFRLSYQEKIFFLLTLYEFVLADTPDSDELERTRSIARALLVQEEDLAFIEHSFGLISISQDILDASSILELRVTGDLESSDVYLPLPGLELIIYKIHNLYCITKKNDNYKVVAESHVLKKNFSARISQQFSIMIETYNIRYQDLIIYFRNKVNQLKERLFIEQDDLELAFSLKRTPESLLELEVTGSHILLSILDRDAVVARNRSRVHTPIHVNLNDEVYVNGFRLDLREVFYFLSARSDIDLSNGKQSYVLSNDIKADIFIHDALADKWTATLSGFEGEYRFEAGNCPYQIFLNGKSITRTAQLQHGDTLFLHDNFIELDLRKQILRRSVFNFRKLIANGLAYRFENGAIGLNDISFDIQYGELVGIMGPSGCGKTTLLNVLAGLVAPEKGRVLVDQYDLHRNYEIIKDYLGYVPQDDLLLPNLTVYENLFYHARLRFPERRKEELQARIELVLDNIRLTDKKNTRVGQAVDKTLSGGERKRLNIGLELLSNAEMYFLDEPTSGLSSKDSEKILEILSNIAMTGKIVVLVIHQPGSKLFKMLNKIILLDNGGRLAYYGTPYSSLEYFKRHVETHRAGDSITEVECPHCKVVQPDVLLDTLEESLKDIDGTVLGERKYPPEYWKWHYRHKVVSSWFSNVKLPTRDRLPPRRVLSFRERFNQFTSMFTRNYTNKVRDRTNLIITFLEAPLLGAVVGFILKYSPTDEYTLYTNELLRTFLFIAVIVSIFLSMTSSVDEILGDSALFLRERMLNLTHRGYLASKLLMLLLFSVVQNALFVAMGFLILEVRELYLPYVAFLTLLSFTGVSTGLFISAMPKLSSKGALNIVPLVLIPQIILGGALIEYEKMNISLTFFKNNPVPEICQLMPSRWAYEGLMILQETSNSYDTRHGELLGEFKQLKLRRSEIAKESGESAFKQQEKELNAEIEIFRSTYKYKYGNKNIHDAIILGEKRFQQLLEEREQAYNIPRSIKPDFSYPLFVKQKLFFFTDIEVSTVYYNACVLCLFALLMNFLTLLALRNRERMLSGGRKLATALDKLLSRARPVETLHDTPSMSGKG